MLKKFFFMNLNTAGVVIGWVEAALSLVACIISMCFIIYSSVKGPELFDDTIKFSLITGASIHLAFNFINLIASVLLVAGTIKKRHLMLTPWLVNSGVYIMLSLLFIGILFVLLFNGIHEVKSAIGFISLSTGFNIYVWCAVYSLYQQFKINTAQDTLLQSIHPPEYIKI